MKSRPVMTAAAIVPALFGLACIFAPDEILGQLHGAAGGPALSGLILQLLGAAWFGIGMTNWYSRTAPIGGIYGRPIVMGNTVHFFAGAMAAGRYAAAHPSPFTLILAVILGLIAAGFLLVLFGPGSKPAGACS